MCATKIKDSIVTGLGEYTGVNASSNAIQIALSNTELDDVAIAKASNIYVKLIFHPEYCMEDVMESLNATAVRIEKEAEFSYDLESAKNIDVNCVRAIIVVLINQMTFKVA